MGRSFTPTYALVLDGNDMMWDVKRHGRPTEANLEKYVMAYAKSLEVGGSNEGISNAFGYIPYPRSAKIVRNVLGGEVVASWKAAMFQIYG